MSAINKVTFTMVGHGPILFGRPVFEPKRDDETHEQLDQRAWRMRAHTTDGNVLCIPATAVKQSLVFAGKWLGIKLKGGKTFTARFKSGVVCASPYFLLSRKNKPLTIDDVEEYPLYVPSDGRPGGTSRVVRRFPKLSPEWECTAEFIVTDNVISEDMIERHAKAAGLHDGIGSMRIGNGGPNGMWKVQDVRLETYAI